MTAALAPYQVETGLIRGARDGEDSACEALFRQFQGPVYTLAYRICQCPDEALDVLQDTFVKAFTRIDQYRDEAPFWAWLRQIAVNQCLSRMRKLRRTDLLSVDPESPFEPDPGAQVDLADAFARLPADTRTIVWLYDVEGYSHQEIAELFGRSVSFSKTQVSRARQRLRGFLETDSEGPLCPDIIPAN